MRLYEFRERCLIGIVSDTHGQLFAGVFNSIKNTDLIIHAGDIGGADILADLKKIAAVVAVRGNMDGGPWAKDLPAAKLIRVAGVWIYVLHNAYMLDIEPNSANIGVVISGHTHRPSIQKKNGVLFLNPGSASQPRYGGPASFALLDIHNNYIAPRIITIAD
jgi:putative phosphoesterase